MLSILDYDIVFLSETHLKGDATLTLNGYVWFGINRCKINKRAKKGSGGAGFLVAERLLKYFECSILDHFYDTGMILACTEKATQFTIHVIGSYLPPDQSNHVQDITDWFEFLCSNLDTGNADLTLITGDLNARIGHLHDDDGERTLSDDSQINNRGRELIEFCKANKLSVLNGKCPENSGFTSQSSRGNAVVDYCITPVEHAENVKLRIIDVECLASKHGLLHLLSDRCKIPDHNILDMKLNLSVVVEMKTETSESLDQGPRYDYNKMSNDFMNNAAWSEASDEGCAFIKSCDDINEALDHFEHIVKEEMESRIPKRTMGKKKKGFKRKKCKPFWNDVLKEKWKKILSKKRAIRKLKKKGRNVSLELKELKLMRRDLDVSLRREAHRERDLLKIKLMESAGKNSSETWSLLKGLDPKPPTRIPMVVRENDVLQSGTDIVMERWRTCYSELFQGKVNVLEREDLAWSRIHDALLDTSDSNMMLNDPISESEVERAQRSIKNGKAAGLDTLKNEVLRQKGLTPLLTCLFNRCFELGKIPDQWRKAVINPIPKAGKRDIYDPNEYRGIALLSCTYKLLSKVVDSRVTGYLEFMELMGDEQNGFRRGRSCIDHIFTLINMIEGRLKKGEETFCLFVDLQKAFDLVDHGLLLERLLEYNIDGKIFRLIHDMYRDGEACIRINGLMTNFFKLLFGVKQGDIVSPSFFNLFINKMIAIIISLHAGIKLNNIELSILLYADDMVLLSGCSDGLQKLMHTAHDWFVNNKLLVSPEKTQVVYFGKSKTAKNLVYQFGKHAIATVSEYKYLGVWIDGNLNFKHQVGESQIKGQKALFDILSKSRKINGFDYQLYTKLVNCCVMSITDYSIGAWGPMVKPSNLSDKSVLLAMRRFLGLPKRSCIASMYLELAWAPILARCKLEVVRLYNRFTSMPNDRLTKRVFMQSIGEHKTSWGEFCYNVLCEIGMIDNFKNKVTVNIKEAQSKIFSMGFLNLCEVVCEKSKLRLYKLVTSDHVKDYVLYASRRQRVILANLLTGTLRLRVESGRFIGEPLQNRLCQVCKEQAVEDELHFLLECTLYDRERTELLKKLDIEERQQDRLVLFEILVRKYSVLLSSFVDTIWKKRTSTMYE